MMQLRWLIVGACLALGAVGGTAHAAPADAESKLQSEVAADLAKLVVLHDGHGHFIAIEPFATDGHFFYSADGKTFYSQRGIGGFADKGQGNFSRTVWSPRVAHEGILKLAGGKWKMVCGTSSRIGGVAKPYQRETPLAILSDKESNALLKKATFKPARWERQAHFLARDNRGVYYFVDAMRPEQTYGKPYGFRLFVGKKRHLRRAKMTDIVNDSAGMIFSTRRGELRFVTAGDTATWIRGKRKKKLVYLPLRENIVLIYRDLGVYKGPLGTPCDDL